MNFSLPAGNSRRRRRLKKTGADAPGFTGVWGRSATNKRASVYTEALLAATFTPAAQHLSFPCIIEVEGLYYKSDWENEVCLMYDVIVVGAGPAGSTAAKVLAEKGLHVLLVERHKLPRYKSCSGVLIQKTMDLVRRYFGEDVPLSATCTPVENRGMIFTDDKGREFRFEQGGLNVWRSSFDNWLTEQAAASGAEVRDSTSAISCEEQEDSITVKLCGESTYTETARYVIDCEGVTGVLKRKLLGNNKDFITTFQTFNRGTIELDPHYFYAYLQPELSEYDAWFNVKDEMLVLGVSVKDASKIEHFYKRFISYMKTHHGLQIEQQVKAEKWLMPHIRPGCSVTYGQGRVLFAGEIAGFLNPMGEGISAGMESGCCAAHAIANHFDSLDMIYADYQRDTQQLKSYMERQWNFVGRMADTFSEMII